MNQKVRRCSRCSNACEEKALGSISAEAAPLKLTILGLPVLECPKKHTSPVNPDFMLWLMHELRARESHVAAGKEEGMLFKKHLCGDCGKELAAKSERRQAFPFDLAYPEAQPFKVEIEMPVYKCTGCGKEQIRSAKDLQKHIPAAVVELNDAAGFPHSG